MSRSRKVTDELKAAVTALVTEGKPVKRAELAAQFGVGQNTVQRVHIWARDTLAAKSLTTEQKIEKAWELVEDREVWAGVKKRMAADAKSRAARNLGLMDRELKTRENTLRRERTARERALDPYSSILKGQQDLNLAAQTVRLIGEFLSRDPYWKENAEPLLKELDSVEQAVADVKALHAPEPDDPTVIDVESWEDPGRALE
ncbi:hypothetical protein [Mycobacterium sp. E787]|uniref:hypothetical protein n=1 Tax=Mycobacterium sp. E787 TaxID=1834150 RepID=UPI00080104BF|nr:hypothetical protein [Mycobacterium sp. E787]OBI56748.1 hypothetical protein A5705_21280 [Mycobacterium sp. E787]